MAEGSDLLRQGGNRKTVRLNSADRSSSDLAFFWETEAPESVAGMASFRRAKQNRVSQRGPVRLDKADEWDYPAFSSRQSDRSRRSTISFVISKSRTRLLEGRWYIRSSISSSRIMRNPRA